LERLSKYPGSVGRVSVEYELLYFMRRKLQYYREFFS